MTNAADWVLVRAPGGGIMGVASSSQRAPLKTGHFDEVDQDFEDASSYGDWQFTYPPSALRHKTTASPDAGTPTGGSSHDPAIPSSSPFSAVSRGTSR
jgi:hypothetical protein